MVRPLALAALLIPAVATAQYDARTWLDWKTIQSSRFAVHFPSELEDWARGVAGRLGVIDTLVSRIVGFRPTQRIDVVIDDPYRSPNGSAWPLIDEPRMVLWATPPSPRDDIGTFVSWADMLVTHEFAHLAHLLRPTRNGFQSLLWKVAPVELGPISRKAPRWMFEGYATHIEGMVTGSGRPNGVWRPTILRQWAIEGTLPTYAQLNTMGGMYGGSFAYLAGSSFIEWLTARRGDSSLVALWRRLSASRDRGFTDAFTGVYGEAPDILYGRFTSELTASARQRDADIRRGGADTGTVIQHLVRETGDPAISRDGGRAAIMLASATRPGRIVIWRTIPEPDTAAERAARALVARDPQDVAPFRPFPSPKRALATLNAVGSQSYRDPRFFSDGRVLVWRNTPIGDGSWAPDLYVWDPQRGSVRRLTHRANLRQGDPSPDGATIAATRCGAGKCDLVLLDVRTGAVTVAAEGSDTRSFHRPRYSPDGRSIAFAMRADGFWRIGVMSVADRSLRVLTTEPRHVFDAAFADDSTLVATAEENGVLNVVRLRADGRALQRITHVSGAAVAPEVNPADGSVWFLALHARGWDVRSASGREAVTMAAPTPTSMPRSLPTAPVGPTTGYSPNRKWIYFPGGNLVRDGAGVTLGLANTDPVGKYELLIQAAKSLSPRSLDAPLEGVTAALTARWRLSPVVSAFAVRQDGPIWYSMNGGSLSASFSRRRERFAFRTMLGATASTVRSSGEKDGASRLLAFQEMSASATRYRAARRTTAQLTLQGAVGERANESIGRVIATGTIASTELPFSFTAQYGRSRSGPPTEQFVLGGNPPTMLPAGVLSQFITQPALPPFFVGHRLETYRLSFPFAGARLYGWAGRAYDESPAPRLEQVLGAEWSASIAALPVLGTPAARATIGVGRWMNPHLMLRQAPMNPAVYIAPPGAFRFYLTTQFGDWSR